MTITLTIIYTQYFRDYEVNIIPLHPSGYWELSKYNQKLRWNGEAWRGGVWAFTGSDSLLLDFNQASFTIGC